ncbi:unnamed protein product [Protopolystoma xenopodis]|uniref:Uncharacterized protein n=1 Tax=Protopolystoma xenopodis TaxID=117903 RepID=A0A3S5CR26_9PLAT|nr:unnamed protein product [Protopolystoma xenopodis]
MKIPPKSGPQLRLPVGANPASLVTKSTPASPSAATFAPPIPTMPPPDLLLTGGPRHTLSRRSGRSALNSPLKSPSLSESRRMHMISVAHCAGRLANGVGRANPKRSNQQMGRL